MKRLLSVLCIVLAVLSGGHAIPFHGKTSPLQNIIKVNKVPLPAASAAGMRSV